MMQTAALEPNLVPEPAPIADEYSPCERCGGDGGFEFNTSINYTVGGYYTAWKTCSACGGEGTEKTKAADLEPAGEPEPVGEPL